jgi:hypothetical protein
MPFNIKLDCLLARRKSINQCNVRYRRPRPRMSSLAQRRVEHALVILMSCENSLTISTMENTRRQIQPGGSKIAKQRKCWTNSPEM